MLLIMLGFRSFFRVLPNAVPIIAARPAPAHALAGPARYLPKAACEIGSRRRLTIPKGTASL